MINKICPYIFFSSLVISSYSQGTFDINVQNGDKTIHIDDEVVIDQQQLQLTKFIAYLSHFKFTYSSGETVTLNEYHLLDLAGKKTINFPNIDLSKVKNFSFAIGVDSAKTMEGVFEGDLDPAKGMFWTWQSGYINFKVEYTINQNQESNYHIGGFSGNQNTFRTIQFDIPTGKTITGLNFNLDEFVRFVNKKGYSSVMSPGTKANNLADHYPQFFSLALE